uniref:Uncharacterized protein n=1 Tax=Arundo donax TaxID=35708 RepID=A0A0A9BFD3_ARUDO
MESMEMWCAWAWEVGERVVGWWVVVTGEERRGRLQCR